MTEKKLYYHLKLYDSVQENFQDNSWFIVSGERITATGHGALPEEDIDKVDLQDKYVMPGMINCHTHIVMDPKNPFMLAENQSIPYLTKLAIDNSNELLSTGVTFFRDVGAKAEIDLEIKKMIDSGDLFGPDCIVSGTPIVMTGGHGYQMGLESDGTAEVLKHTRQLLKKGVGCIKVMATGGVMTAGESPDDEQLSFEELKVAITEAHHKGRNTAAHAQGLSGVKNAILAGVDSIEHGVYLDDEAVEMLLSHGTYLSPTLVAPYYIVEEGEKYNIPSYMVEKSKKMLDDHQKSLAKAIKAGVKIVLGTDAGTPFNLYKNTPYELELMMQCGMTSQQALRAATTEAAELLKISDNYGSLVPGKYADFLVLAQNPLENIKVLQEKKTVYKKGQKVSF